MQDNIEKLPTYVKVALPSIINGLSEDERANVKDKIKDMVNIKSGSPEKGTSNEVNSNFIDILIKDDETQLSEDSLKLLYEHFSTTNNLV